MALDLSLRHAKKKGVDPAEIEFAQVLIVEKIGQKVLAFHQALGVIEKYPNSLQASQAVILVEKLARKGDFDLTEAQKIITANPLPEMQEPEASFVHYLSAKDHRALGFQDWADKAEKKISPDSFWFRRLQSEQTEPAKKIRGIYDLKIVEPEYEVARLTALKGQRKPEVILSEAKRFHETYDPILGFLKQGVPLEKSEVLLQLALQREEMQQRTREIALLKEQSEALTKKRFHLADSFIDGTEVDASILSKILKKRLDRLAHETLQQESRRVLKASEEIRVLEASLKGTEPKREPGSQK